MKAMQKPLRMNSGRKQNGDSVESDGFGLALSAMDRATAQRDAALPAGLAPELVKVSRIHVNILSITLQRGAAHSVYFKRRSADDRLMTRGVARS